MKVVLLAGGYGTRISEESHLRPKPMIELGGKPILWHIMKCYSSYGFSDFIICCGYKQYMIKEYFANYSLHNSDVTFDYRNGKTMEVHSNVSEPWRVTLVDTGLDTMTGGRIKRVMDYIANETFMLTYGDGVSDINIAKLAEFHKSHDKAVTMTIVKAKQRFGLVKLGTDGAVEEFREKKTNDDSLINGGFMVLDPCVLDYIEGDTTAFEREPLEKLADMKEIMAYVHDGFWHCMDTQRDKQELDAFIKSGQAPWST